MRVPERVAASVRHAAIGNRIAVQNVIFECLAAAGIAWRQVPLGEIKRLLVDALRARKRSPFA